MPREEVRLEPCDLKPPDERAMFKLRRDKDKRAVRCCICGRVENTRLGEHKAFCRSCNSLPVAQDFDREVEPSWGRIFRSLVIYIDHATRRK